MPWQPTPRQRHPGQPLYRSRGSDDLVQDEVLYKVHVLGGLLQAALPDAAASPAGAQMM